MILETLPAVQALSLKQKYLLMDELWAEIHTDPQKEERSAAIKALLEKRHAEFLANPDSFLTWEEHRAKLTEARRERRKVPE